MKIRSQLFTLLALVLLSWNASAQARSGTRFTKKPAPVPAREFGSLERTKLLQMGRAARASEGTKQLGSVQRRTLLTTGKALKLPQKQRSRNHHRR